MAVLVGLYEEPEKPANALEYAPTPALGRSRGATAPTEEPPWSCAHGSFIKMTLGAPTGVDVEALKVRHDPSLAGSWPVAHVGEANANTRSPRLPRTRSAQAENENLRKKCDEMTLKLDEANKKV